MPLPPQTTTCSMCHTHIEPAAGTRGASSNELSQRIQRTAADTSACAAAPPCCSHGCTLVPAMPSCLSAVSYSENLVACVRTPCNHPHGDCSAALGCGAAVAPMRQHMQQWHWSLEAPQLCCLLGQDSSSWLRSGRVLKGCLPGDRAAVHQPCALWPSPSGSHEVAHSRWLTSPQPRLPGGDFSPPPRHAVPASDCRRRCRPTPPPTLCTAMSASTFGDFSRERAARARRLLVESEEHRGSNDVQASKSAS